MAMHTSPQAFATPHPWSAPETIGCNFAGGRLPEPSTMLAAARSPQQPPPPRKLSALDHARLVERGQMRWTHIGGPGKKSTQKNAGDCSPALWPCIAMQWRSVQRKHFAVW
jgi:hypothetical protein